MNNPCLLTNMTNSDIAAWAQAIVSTFAIVVGAIVVRWQVKRGRKDLLVAEARRLDGLARLLVHLRDAAQAARAEKHKMQRFPTGHPAEPHNQYVAVAQATIGYPLENFEGEVAFEALLNARRVAREAEPLVNPDAELDLNPDYQATFEMYMKILNDQIVLLRTESHRLITGELTRFTVEPAAIGKAGHAV